jgi:hypothetical protein
MTLNIGVPRWFLDERYFKNTEVRRLVTEILNMYGKLFVPLTLNCREEIRNKYSCEYSKTRNQIKNLIHTAKKVTSLRVRLTSITLHTEYQLPQWWNREFIDNYIQAINIALKELQSENIKFSKLIIEIHPGFGGAQKERAIDPIVRGIVELVKGIVDEVYRSGLDLAVAVETRGSSSTVDRRPQAVATLEELEVFRDKIEKALKEEGVSAPVTSVIDPPQLLTAYQKMLRKEKSLLVDHVVKMITKYIEMHQDKVGEIHIHWYRDQDLKQSHAPVAPTVWNTVYMPIIRSISSQAEVSLVPEISPMVNTSDIVTMLRLLYESTQLCNFSVAGRG